MESDTRQVIEALRVLKRPSRRSKYGNRTFYLDGERFDSVAEGAYYQRLVLLKAAGEVEDFHRQVRLDLGAGIAYVADFLVWLKGAVACGWFAVDVKGVLTKEFRLKARLFKDKFPSNQLIIAKAVYRGKQIIGFNETVYGERRKRHVDFQ